MALSYTEPLYRFFLCVSFLYTSMLEGVPPLIARV